jgi:hypothetical protein
MIALLREGLAKVSHTTKSVEMVGEFVAINIANRVKTG